MPALTIGMSVIIPRTVDSDRSEPHLPAATKLTTPASTHAGAGALGDLWLNQTSDLPPTQTAPIEPAVPAEYFMGYDDRRQAWVRFGVMSTGQYFAIRMTETDNSGWSWKYVSFFRTQNPETPG